jgi:colicin import membrane protein
MNRTTHILAAALVLGSSSMALAALPPPSPEQAAAAAAKKAQADAQAQKEKEELLATMDAVAARWRSRATAQDKRVAPPVPVGAQTAAVTAPATGAAPAGQPGGKLGPLAEAAPVRSEKAGTAPPSKDVKPGPSKALPPGTPTSDKK